MTHQNNSNPCFAGKVAIVTGGTCGIGGAIAMALLQCGVKVCVSTLAGDVDQGKQVFGQAGFEPLIIEGDMRHEAFCQQVIDKTVAQYGRLDYLVNNAFSFVAKYTDATRCDWHRSLEVGPIAYSNMVSLAVEPMKKSGGGAIVNVSSISAFIAQPKRWTYNASKGAVRQLTKCMALDLAPFHIRVNSVSPGWTWTRETDLAANYDRAKYDKIWGQFCMLERMAEPMEIAKPVLFLLSEDASFITGTDLPVDGGYQSLGPEGLGQNTIVAGST